MRSEIALDPNSTLSDYYSMFCADAQITHREIATRHILPFCGFLDHGITVRKFGYNTYYVPGAFVYDHKSKVELWYSEIVLAEMEYLCKIL